MYCPSCGKLIDDDSKFCPYCGKACTGGGPTGGGGTPAPPRPRPKGGNQTQLVSQWDEHAQVPEQEPAPVTPVKPGGGGGSAWDVDSPQHVQEGPRRASGRSKTWLIPVVALVTALAIGGGCYVALFTNLLVSDETLVGSMSMTEHLPEKNYVQALAIDAKRDGSISIFFRGVMFQGTVARAGDFHGSALYHVEDIRLTSGHTIDDVTITLAAPLGASKGKMEGVWAICVHDNRKGNEFFRSEVAVVDAGGTASFEVFKDTDVFAGEWTEPKGRNQTWVEKSDGVYTFHVAQTGSTREVLFPGT